MESAIERWRSLIDARAQQMDAAFAQLGRTSADYWDRRARGFHRATKDSVAHDPFYRKLSQVVTPQTSVLDVGAGTGRLALALAPQAKQVIAVEPSEAMLRYLQQDATEQGITNISYVSTAWQDAPADMGADVVLCSHVLYPIREVDAFLAKLRSATHRACYILMRATQFDEITGHLWQHFHGEKRCLNPSYIHAFDVMYEMELFADVEVVKLAQSMRFPSLESAVEEMREQLILPDNEQIDAELRALLEGWLVERNGMLTFPVDEMVGAIMHWSC